MCGIAGAVWNDADKAVERATLQRMIDVLRHRGPDGEGVYLAEGRVQPGSDFAPGVALGHRRLAIIDVAGGQQPLANEDGSVWIVFNGEIYNFRDLRRRLEGAGHQFRTHSDTEAIVHLYEEEGPEFVTHLNGMFALALWDAKRQQLILARDRLGKKPLVYRHEPGRLLFASELKSLLEVPGVPREIDPQALDEYLTYQYVPHPRTILRGIAKLPPGHYAVYREGRLDVRSYWQPDFNLEEARPAAEYAEELRTLLTLGRRVAIAERSAAGGVPFRRDRLDDHRRADVATGRRAGADLLDRLSGQGVRRDALRPGGGRAVRHDPRGVSGAARRDGGLAAAGVALRRAVRRQFGRADVVRFATDAAARHRGADRRRRRRVVRRLSALPGGVAGRGLRSLAAIGFGGFSPAVFGSGCRRARGRSRWGGVSSGSSKCSANRRRVATWNGSPFSARRVARRCIATIFWPGCPTRIRLSFLTAALARSNRRDAVTAFSLADLVTYLPCDLMTKVDIASMAHGLECRQPFLDYRVVELAARMPARLKFRRGQGKRILRETFADLLPRSIQRRPKMGFGVPLDHWFRHELRDFTREILLDKKNSRTRLFPARGGLAALGRAPGVPLQPRLPALVAADLGVVAAGVDGSQLILMPVQTRAYSGLSTLTDALAPLYYHIASHGSGA